MGRPKGAKNIRTQYFDQFVAFMLGDNMRRLQKEFDKLEGKDLVQATTGLLEFCAPKLARQEVTGKDGGPVEVIEVPTYKKK